MTHSGFSFSSTDSHFSCHQTIFVSFPDPGRWNETDLPFIVTWAVCDLSRESLMYSWSGHCRSPPPWLAWQHTPGLWLAETRSRDQDPGFLLADEDRHRSRQTGRMKAAAADVFFSQCDFCPVTFKWHGLGVLWWNTYTSMAQDQVLKNIIKQLSLLLSSYCNNTQLLIKKFFTS